MELSSEEAPIPIPIPLPLNSRYGGHDHLLHHHNHHDRNHIIAATTANGGGSPVLATEDLHHHHNSSCNNNNQMVKKGGVKYKECLKNHAASMGGNATDGCGEFMPSGEEGSIEALTCSACNCHRNFHRKETDGDPSPSPSSWLHHSRLPRKLIMPPEAAAAFYPTAAGAFISSRAAAAAPQHMIMSYNMVGGGGQSESEEQDQGPGPMAMMANKKRFRTKFSVEQKEKMLRFAEKVGWKIQKQEESMVQQFCQEIGVKRRVLKVWMHNNKHNLAKNNILNLKDNTTNSPSTTPLN